ncbi:hypothetical protein [Streptomyces roseolus]
MNPVSRTNWEGAGVRPDIVCAADDALDHAHGLALTRLKEPEALDDRFGG